MLLSGARQSGLSIGHPKCPLRPLSGALWGGTFHSIGNRILRKHADKLGFQRDFTILDLLVDGNKVATRWTANIHHVPSGQTFPMEIGNFIEIENGKIVSVVEFMDTAFVGQALAKMTA